MPKRYTDKMKSRFDSRVRPLKHFRAISAVSRDLTGRATLEKLSSATLSSSINQLSKQLGTTSSVIHAMTEANESIKAVFESTRTARRHMSSMVSASVAAQAMFTHLEESRLAVAYRVSSQNSIRAELDRLTTSYNGLFGFIGSQSAANLAKLAPVVTQYPPLEIYREANLLKEITMPDEEQDSFEEERICLVPEERPLEDWLQQLDPNLGNLLCGARAAISGSNPDRARHVTTSVRELFTHVLHRLAPDDAIRRWNSDNEYYYKGKPIRRARLLYINRGINVDPLSKFVDADVKSALTLIDSLHAGTHGISSRLTERQLQVIVDRIETLLLFLFRLNETNE